MTIKPLAKNIIIKTISEQKTESGIILPDSEKKSEKGEVVAVGDEVAQLKAGDKIIFKKYGPEEIEFEREKYLICEEDDVLAVIE